MRTALTIGRVRGSDEVTLLRGAEIPLSEQLTKFKSEFLAKEVNDDLEEVQLWTSDEGIIKRAFPLTSEEVKARAEKRAAIASKTEAEAKAKAQPVSKPAEAKPKGKAKAQPATPK